MTRLQFGMITALSIFLLAPFTTSLAQEDEKTERQLVSDAMRRLRSRATRPDDRELLVEQLIELGFEGPRQLAAYLAREHESAAKKRAKAEPKFLKRFFQRALVVGKNRTKGKAQKEVDAARDVVLRLAGDGSLTKSQVKNESDPAMSALHRILTVDVNDVWEGDEKLYEQFCEMLEELDAAALQYAWWQSTSERLTSFADGQKALSKLTPPADPDLELRRLLDELARLAELATPMTDSDRSVFEKNHQLAGEIDAKEYDGIVALNLIRVRLGIGALRIDVKLCTASRGHSEDMNKLGFFSHTSPVEGKKSFGQRASLAGTSASAENIAMGSDTGPGVITQWWYSPGHHRNMLARHGRIGLGRYERHWTQMFG